MTATWNFFWTFNKIHRIWAKHYEIDFLMILFILLDIRKLTYQYSKFTNSSVSWGPDSESLSDRNCLKNWSKQIKKGDHPEIFLIVMRIARVCNHPTCVYASSIHACISLKCELSVRNMIKHSHSFRLRYAIILQNRKRNHVFESWNFPLVTAMKKLVSFSNSNCSDHDYFG